MPAGATFSARQTMSENTWSPVEQEQKMWVFFVYSNQNVMVAKYTKSKN